MATEPTREQMEQLFSTLKEEEPQVGKMHIKGKPMLQHEFDTISSNASRADKRARGITMSENKPKKRQEKVIKPKK